MRKGAGVAAVLVATWLTAGALFAADIVGMPVGNPPKPGTVEVNYIYWDDFLHDALPNNPSRPDHISVLEVYYGVTDRLEINTLTFQAQGGNSETELNVAYTVIPETPDTPSLIVGAYNLNQVPSRGLPGQVTPISDVAPFALSAFNARVPQNGPPSLSDPLIRLHLGYGGKIHGDDFFGGVQFLVDPHLGGAILNYQGQPGYMLTYIPNPGKKLEISLGTLQGEPFGRIGYVWNG